jgi:hypothetical protein
MQGDTVTQTEYVVRILVPRTTHEMHLRHSSQFTPAIRDAIHAAVRQAAQVALRQYIESGELDDCFVVRS